MIPQVYGNSYQIVQAPGLLAIRYEMVHDTRIIRLDGAPHPGAQIHLDMGDARGHWDGSTLVVETTNSQAAKRVSQRERRDLAHRRALYAEGAWHTRLVSHGR
jgi:hypothetical protein